MGVSLFGIATFGGTMSTARSYVPHYTVEDYRQWKGDWELWDGIAIAMTPSPFGGHQALLVAIVSEFRLALRNAGCHATVLADLDWIVRNDTVVRPDMAVVCGGVPEKHLETAPALIAEILSPSTRRNDLTYKRELYASQGVSTYLIVDPTDKTITQLALTDSGEYQPVDAPRVLKITICDECTVEIESSRIFMH
jgi:Uma2 family endonuclease